MFLAFGVTQARNTRVPSAVICCSTGEEGGKWGAQGWECKMLQLLVQIPSLLVCRTVAMPQLSKSCER